MIVANIPGRLEALFTVPAGIAISATNSGGGPTAVSLTAGAYTPTSFVAHVVARLNAVRTPANWTGSLSTTTGLTTLNWTGAGTYSIAWTSTDARDMLGFAANLTAITQGVASVGTLYHRGVWIPNCSLFQLGRPKSVPIVSDLRVTVAPNGSALGLLSTYKYVHRGLRWQCVEAVRTWETESGGSVKGSWEQWVKDTQLLLGHAWFTVLSGFHVYNHDALLLGADLNAGAGPTLGWKLTDVDSAGSIEPKMTQSGFSGMWTIEMPTLEASSS